MTVKDIDYHAPRFVELANRWIPVLAKGGVPSARGEWVLGDANGSIKRRELEERQVSSVFLRDGDEFRQNLGLTKRGR